MDPRSPPPADREAEVLPFRRVTPGPAERYETCVPLVDLQAVAGAWRAQQNVPEPLDPSVSWVTWEGSRRFAEGMFVARVVGRSMEPLIPDGAYCLFRRVALPSSPERAVLVRHAGVENPETGGRYTVKRSREGKGPNGEKQVVLEPVNAAFAPIVITSPGEGDVRVIAEVVEVLGGSGDPGETGRDPARAPGGTPRERFEALVARWHAETGGWSNPHKIVAHPSYRAIVAMGMDAVPFILEDLEENSDPDFWGPALREITGETVQVAPPDAGRLDVVAKAWLALAKKKGWLETRARRA
jgi:hypothetical protein